MKITGVLGEFGNSLSFRLRTALLPLARAGHTWSTERERFFVCTISVQVVVNGTLSEF